MRCGTTFWAAHGFGRSEVGWAFCPRCGQATPSLPPRPKAPLFTWEVYRHFYPEPAWPRSPTPNVRQILVVLALVAGIALLGVGGAFGYLGAVGLSPNSRNIGGTVYTENATTGIVAVAPGAVVTLNNLSKGAPTMVVTNAQGAFDFPSVPAGEHQLQVQMNGYRLSQMELFLASLFTAPGNLSHLAVNLVQGNLSSTYDQPFAPYPDLETYASYLFSAAAVEVIGGVVALWGALALRSGQRVARGVVGAFAALLAPFLASISGYDVLFLQVAPVTVILAGITAVVAALSVVLLLSTQRPLDGVAVPPAAPPS